jgi:Na+/H+-dicarboxylate symporter
VRHILSEFGRKTGASRVQAAAGRILGILFLCFVIGVVLTFLGTTPRTLFTDVWGAILDVWGFVVDLLAWALPYILLGAIVVVPIAVISWLLRAARRG